MTFEAGAAEMPLHLGRYFYVSGGGKTSDVLAFRRWSDEREFQKSKEL